VLARLLLWRLLGLAAILLGLAASGWLLHGGPGAALRGLRAVPVGLPKVLAAPLSLLPTQIDAAGCPAGLLLGLSLGLGAFVGRLRWRARRRRRYVRLRVVPYRTDRTSAEGIVAMFEALHKRLLRRWWRRLLAGQPSVSLEVHCARHGAGARAWLAVACPRGSERMVEAALRSAYPNSRLARGREPAVGVPATVVRLKKRTGFIRRAKLLDRYELAREPPMDRLLNVMAACGESALVQLALTPAPALFERRAKRLYKRHEAHLSRKRREHLLTRDRSLVEDSELRGGLEVQHRPLFFVDLRVAAGSRGACERIASELRAEGAENSLVERGAALRHGLLGLYDRRIARGEGNPWPSLRRGVFASTELAALWHLPSVDYAAVPFARGALPLAPAPPAIMRPGDGTGVLRDALGPVSIHPELRRQNTAVPGTVEQGKSSFLVATVAEDLRRERCAVIVLDPKGDAAEAAVSLVGPRRTCTLLDLAHPTCGFDPLAAQAPADTIADYVVAALKHLFSDADIRASSDRYLRNAIIAVLAYDRRGTLWDAARLLSVGEDGYAYRARVAARVRTLPEFKEISEFFTAELAAQLADARSMTTAKLDAPVNKLARLLNSPSIKRVLRNDSLTVDFDRVIANCEVLVVKGALGAMGAGNTSVMMQLLVGMLDAALARQQDLVPADERVAVALKVDEAPLALNRGFAETMALKRSAGLETVACWQTDAQWADREVRDQLDALFAHRVYFATASVRDARAAAGLMMAEFADSVRPDQHGLSALGHPDARLHLPRHHAIVSWTTPVGRQPPFVARTIPLRVDRERLALHAARQARRGGRYLADLSQPHWERSQTSSRREPAPQTSHGEAPAEPRRVEDGRESWRSERPLPRIAAESYRELVDLDAAHSVRWARRVPSPTALTPDRLDLEILALVAGMQHVLTTQIHRRFNPGRAVTTTQRRLKRLSDAGLVGRFQFHRRDGGGAPMCYSIAAAGLELLRAHERLGTTRETLSAGPSVEGDRWLRQARHDVHVTGWALALERTLEGSALTLRGPAEAVLSPPLRATAAGRVAIGPGDLRLAGGRTPHDFLRTDPAGTRVEVERFETVRPDVTIAASSSHRPPGPNPPRTVDLMVEFDDRLSTRSHPAAVAKLERYDHLLAGWSVCVDRYGRRAAAEPLVVFVCRDRPRARECARGADHVLTACRAYAGEYPYDWEYPGRAAIVFASERDAHEGSLLAYGVPRLPPEVRALAANGDRRAREPVAEPREILPAAL
jgi:Replication-relaxation